MSVDTYSDLKYLNIIFKFSKNKNLNFRDLIKYNIFSILNTHVTQRKIFNNYNQKINIITTIEKNNIFNKYSKIIEREIRETISTNINIIYLENFRKSKKLYLTKKDINIICIKNHLDEKIRKYPKNIFIEDCQTKTKNYIKVSSKKVKNKKVFINDRHILENYLLKNNNLSISEIEKNISKRFSQIGCSGIINEVLKFL